MLRHYAAFRIWHRRLEDNTARRPHLSKEMREVTKPSPERVPKPSRTALVMNSIPTNVSTPRTATSTSTNTMPNAIMRSLAASLLMSQGMLCKVTEPETSGREVGREVSRRKVRVFAPNWVGLGCDHPRSRPSSLGQDNGVGDRAFLVRRSNISASFRHCRQQEQPRHHCHC